MVLGRPSEWVGLHIGLEKSSNGEEDKGRWLLCGCHDLRTDAFMAYQRCTYPSHDIDI